MRIGPLTIDAFETALWVLVLTAVVFLIYVTVALHRLMRFLQDARQALSTLTEEVRSTGAQIREAAGRHGRALDFAASPAGGEPEQEASAARAALTQPSVAAAPAAASGALAPQVNPGPAGSGS